MSTDAHRVHIPVACGFKKELPQVAVVGVGAVGSVVAAVLDATKRCKLTLVARGTTLDAIKSDGLRVRWTHEGASTESEYAFRPDAIHPASTASIGVQDYVIVASKSREFADDVDSILPLIGEQTLVITCMDGLPFWYFYEMGGDQPAQSLPAVDPDGRLWTKIDPRRAIGCAVDVDAEVLSPGVVLNSISSSKNCLTFGEPDVFADTKRLRKLCMIFPEIADRNSQPVPFHASLVDGCIRNLIWDKLLVHICSDSLCALTRSTLAGLAKSGHLRAMYSEMVKEVIAVGEQQQPPIRFSMDWQAVLAETREVRPSALQDVLAGRQIEKDSTWLAFQALAQSAGVATPTVDLVFGLLVALDANIAK